MMDGGGWGGGKGGGKGGGGGGFGKGGGGKGGGGGGGGFGKGGGGGGPGGPYTPMDGHGWNGGWGGPPGMDPSGGQGMTYDMRMQRDDERDRERARNGVRGLRSNPLSGFGYSGFGAITMVNIPPEIARLKDTINPMTFDIAPKYARFYVIKSYSEDDVHKSIKYGVWASTDTGNRRLDAAYRESCNRGPIYLFFSVNASGQFSGLAQMESALDYTKKFGSWGQDKWNGTFQVRASKHCTASSTRSQPSTHTPPSLPSLAIYVPFSDQMDIHQRHTEQPVPAHHIDKQ